MEIKTAVFLVIEGNDLLLQTPLAARGGRRAEDRHAEVQRGDGSARREHSGRGGGQGMVQYGRHEGVAPRALDPYSSPGHNPFWSEGVRNASVGRGDTGSKGGGAYAERTDVDIEKIKAKCMRDAEEAFSKELRRLGVVVEGESESYHTASSRKKRDVVKDNVVQFLMVQGVPGGMDGGRRGPGPPRSESC